MITVVVMLVNIIVVVVVFVTNVLVDIAMSPNILVGAPLQLHIPHLDHLDKKMIPRLKILILFSFC